MSKRPEGNMVMRSVYLPEELDNRLRAVAFLHNRSKGDLIRELVQAGLGRMEEEVRLASVAEPVILAALERSLGGADVRGVNVTEVAREVAAAAAAGIETAVGVADAVPRRNVESAA